MSATESSRSDERRLVLGEIELRAARKSADARGEVDLLGSGPPRREGLLEVAGHDHRVAQNAHEYALAPRVSGRGAVHQLVDAALRRRPRFSLDSGRMLVEGLLGPVDDAGGHIGDGDVADAGLPQRGLEPTLLEDIVGSDIEDLEKTGDVIVGDACVEAHLGQVAGVELARERRERVRPREDLRALLEEAFLHHLEQHDRVAPEVPLQDGHRLRRTPARDRAGHRVETDRLVGDVELLDELLDILRGARKTLVLE
jgi:hypothetical protein